MGMDRGSPDPMEFQRRMAEWLRDMISPKPGVVGEDSGEGKPEEKPSSKIRFDLKPEELEAYLDEYVVKQERAKAVLSTKICTHFHRIKMELENPQDPIPGEVKPNILMIGPTGVGKTYIVKLIARKLGVPFVKGDATKFSETGYVGGDVEDLVRDLVREAGGDVELAQYGIIYIDEIDKIASSGTTVGPDVSRTGVQRNLLKLMEETEVDLRVPHDIISQIEAMMQFQRTGKIERKKINTRHILFVMSGAFYGLEDIVRRRLNQQAIGFGVERSLRGKSRMEVLQYVQPEDLIEYGFESEFVGRLPVIVVLDELTVDDLYEILRSPKSSVVQSKKRDFKAYGIDLEFTDGALRQIAERAYKRGTGARALVSVCEEVLLPFEKKLPSTSVRRLTVTEEMTEDPEGELERLLREAPVREFEEEFRKEHGIRLRFSEGALRWIEEEAARRETKPEELCRELLKDYGYGLKLVNAEEFEVTEEVLEDPKGYLDRLIKSFYAKASS